MRTDQRIRWAAILGLGAGLVSPASAQTKTTAAAPAAAAAAFVPGAYEVRASLQLPNIDDLNVDTVRTLCLVATGAPGNHGFAVMSQNNPLAHCPMVNVHEAGDTLTFDIKCPGSNLAKASATYLLMGDKFRGRIAMTMGGKNMTMTEVQEGHRLGACRPSS